MTAETEPETDPLDAGVLRKRAIQLRSFIDQGDFRPGDDDDEQLLTQVFTEGELDAIEEHNDILYLALTRVQDDYDKACEAGAALEASQNAIDAHVLVLSMEQDADDADDAADAAGMTEADPEDLPPVEDDPDADLDEESDGEEE